MYVGLMLAINHSFSFAYAPSLKPQATTSGCQCQNLGQALTKIGEKIAKATFLKDGLKNMFRDCIGRLPSHKNSQTHSGKFGVLIRFVSRSQLARKRSALCTTRCLYPLWSIPRLNTLVQNLDSEHLPHHFNNDGDSAPTSNIVSLRV